MRTRRKHRCLHPVWLLLREEMVGMSAKELRPTEEVPRFEKYVSNDVIHGDAGTWTHKRKDRDDFPVSIRYHAIEYNGRKARFVIVTPGVLISADDTYPRSISAITSRASRTESLIVATSLGLDLISSPRSRIAATILAATSRAPSIG